MCGRFTLTTQPKALVELFDLDELPEELRPRFNIAPSQSIPAEGLKAVGHYRSLTFLQALLVPYSADEMEAVDVSKLVNSPKNDVPELLNSA